jgi:hypothetical protein
MIKKQKVCAEGILINERNKEGKRAIRRRKKTRKW